MNCQFMVEHDSVVMKGYGVEDPVINYKDICVNQWENINCSLNQTHWNILTQKNCLEI